MFAAEMRCYLARILLCSGDTEGALSLAAPSVAMLKALSPRST
jgi:hypothetical protein